MQDTLEAGSKLLEDKERKMIEKLNPDDSGPVAFHEVIAWALHDVVAQTSAQTVTYTGPQVLKKALDSQTNKYLEKRAEEFGVYFVDEESSYQTPEQKLKERTDLIDSILSQAAKASPGKLSDNIEDWNRDQVGDWINGIKDVNDSTLKPPDTPGECFKCHDIRGRELLRLTRQDIIDILNSADSQSSTNKKVVARTKRILSSIERVRGDDARLSDSVAHELIEMILSLRGSLTALYGFKNQPVSSDSPTTMHACVGSVSGCL